MSLKAKIEAVIYASEEPVTLAQLVGLLGQEGQAELDRVESAQQSLTLHEPGQDLDNAAEATVPEGEPAEVEAGQTAVSAESPESGSETVQAEAAEAEEPNAEAASETAQAETEISEQPAEGSPASDQVAEPDAAAIAKAEKARSAKLRAYFRSLLDELVADYANGDRGIEIREVGGGYRLATKPEYHDAVRGFVKSLKPPLKLSLQALETLAVVAYKQPVTAPEVSEIRGVDSAGVLGSLISRKLVTTAGRKQVIGRPILYKTTKDFLLKFGLKDLSELPSIEEFEKMASQMAEQEEIIMPDAADPRPDVQETARKLESERDDHEPQPDGDPREPSAADNVSEETGDKASVDGRIASLPPDYQGEELRDNPSAQEAQIQSGE